MEIHQQKYIDPICDSRENRLTVYPIKHPKIWESYKYQQAAIWNAEEIDFQEDYDDFMSLTENEQKFIKYILAFFASSDIIVNINLAERFSREVNIIEATIAYQFQIMMENIHAETYSLQINNIIRDEEEKRHINNAIVELPCLKEKAEWVFNWIKSDSSYAQRLIAFAIVEGVFFSGSFCSIFWIKKYKNKMPGLVTSNEFIARDEGMHTDFACLIYNDYIHSKNKLSQESVHEMMKEAVEIESRFICESLSCGLIGMNSKLMIEYIQFVADHLLLKLNYTKIWNNKNPFPWMESLSLEGKTNFFESRASQYQKASVFNKSNNQEFEILDDF